MKVIQVIGKKKAGKTSFIEALIRHFKNMELAVGTVKHTVNEYEVDKTGSDSYRHREAGADRTAFISGKGSFIFYPRSEDEHLLICFNVMTDMDFVILEGYKSKQGLPKIIICSDQFNPHEETDPYDNILFCVSDKDIETNGIPVYKTSDIKKIADELLNRPLTYRF